MPPFLVPSVPLRDDDNDAHGLTCVAGNLSPFSKVGGQVPVAVSDSRCKPLRRQITETEFVHSDKGCSSRPGCCCLLPTLAFAFSRVFVCDIDSSNAISPKHRNWNRRTRKSDEMTVVSVPLQTPSSCGMPPVTAGTDVGCWSVYCDPSKPAALRSRSNHGVLHRARCYDWPEGYARSQTSPLGSGGLQSAIDCLSSRSLVSALCHDSLQSLSLSHVIR